MPELYEINECYYYCNYNVFAFISSFSLLFVDDKITIIIFITTNYYY